MDISSRINLNVMYHHYHHHYHLPHHHQPQLTIAHNVQALRHMRVAVICSVDTHIQ